MALAGALCPLVHAVAGFTNKRPRGQIVGLLGHPYTNAHMSYDLRRLRLHGLIQRLPRSNRYVLTAEDIRVAVFYTKLHNRLLRRSSAPTDQPRHSTSAAPSPPSNAAWTTTSPP